MFNNIRRQSRLAQTLDTPNKNQEISNDEENKKAVHRENEKKRRQKMATLYSSLRSVLPLEFIKGKRSLADHMNEAVNYIKRVQTRIGVLGGRRDELQEWWLSNLSANSNSTLGLGNTCCDYSTGTRVAVHPCLGGVEIVISTNGGSTEQALLLPTLLKAVYGQGLDVISCASAQVNKRLVFTIQSEVSDLTHIDFSGLHSVLTEAVSLSKISK